MIRATHNPYSECDRFPLGAVSAGSTVRLRVHTEDELKYVFVRLWRGEGEEWQILRQGAEDGVYECVISIGADTGVLWYWFMLETADGYKNYLGKPIGGECAVYDYEPASFQITVYNPAFASPEWMRDSVMMQILPDRFCAGGAAIPPHAEGAFLHKDWYEPPCLCPREALDFYGGNLNGIREKIPFFKDMGIRALYLNPIFMARSNHKYDTGDYMRIDPSFGTEKDLTRLLDDAAAEGIHVVLDGVFSHTGADSRYFNRFGTYDSKGAYNSFGNSPYSAWYRFLTDKDDYDCWWGIETLPNVNETEPSYMDFIVRGRDSVVAHYINKGISGWRLDVADELPMEFIRALRERVKRENREACVIGEVWEDITYKISYGRPRCYAKGDTLDSAMNYPLREHVIAFILGKESAYTFAEFLNHQLSTLPSPMYYSMMNLLGSHDKPRIINVLAEDTELEPERGQRRFVPLSNAQYELGKARFIKAFELVCALPGMPCLYYGDDAGLTGMTDPFCRAAYPWGREDGELQSAIKDIIRRRNASNALRRGETKIRALDAQRIELQRDDKVLTF